MSIKSVQQNGSSNIIVDIPTSSSVNSTTEKTALIRPETIKNTAEKDLNRNIILLITGIATLCSGSILALNSFYDSTDTIWAVALLTIGSISLCCITPKKHIVYPQ
jgi:hypothetical protein